MMTLLSNLPDHVVGVSASGQIFSNAQRADAEKWIAA